MQTSKVAMKSDVSEGPKESTDGKDKGHVCVLCSNVLPTKEELQDHFRKHANKEIDYRGQPTNKRFTLKKNVTATTTSTRPVAPVAKAVPPPVALPAKPAVKPVRSVTVYGSKLRNVPVVAEVETVKKPLPPTPPPPTPPVAIVLPPKPPTSINCDVCGQAFETVTYAIQHKFRKHPNSSLKYYCPFCGMQFPLKYNQEIHIEKNHKDEEAKGKFPCTDCGIEFHTDEAHSYHVKSTHKRIVAFFKPIVTPPPSKKIKLNNANEAQSVYYCHLCGYEYIVKFNLQKHLERQHTDAERDGMPSSLMKCTTCDALFYNKRAYDNHNMYHKPDDLYVTSEEQRLQTVTRVDQDFDIRRVIQPVDKYMAKVRPGLHKRRRRSHDTTVKPTLSNLSDSELSPASTPPTSDSEEEPERPEKVVIKTEEVEKEEVAMEKRKAVVILEKLDKIVEERAKTPPLSPPSKKTKKASPVPVPQRSSTRVTRSKAKVSE